MSPRIYLDWNATAPLRPEARAAVVEALASSGNPSSVHADGRGARALVETARAKVAALVGANPHNVIFTSTGTEANALALTPSLQAGSREALFERLIVSAIEHPSVLAGGRFAVDAVQTVAVTPSGTIDLPSLKAVLAANTGAALVSIMAANNETGVVQPIAEAAEIVHAAGGLMHVDAVQFAGRIPISINELRADLVTVSSHKLGGPQGAAALVLRDGMLQIGDPLIRGGGQERGRRAGTENVAAIAGFGAAAAEAGQRLGDEAAHMLALRARLETGLRSIRIDTVIFGESAPRLPNTTLFAVPDVKAETALIALDLRGVAVSSGSACSSGKVAASHVLSAMNVPPSLAEGAIRVSAGPATSAEDIDSFLEAWRNCVGALVRGRREIAA